MSFDFLFSILDLFTFIFMCVRVCHHVYICTTYMPGYAEFRREHWVPWNWSYRLSCGCWELNLGFCKSSLLSTDLSFQPSSVNLISHLDGVRPDFSARSACVSRVTVVTHHVLRCSQVFVVRVCLCLKCLLIPIAHLLIELVMLLKSDVLYF